MINVSIYFIISFHFIFIETDKIDNIISIYKCLNYIMILIIINILLSIKYFFSIYYLIFVKNYKISLKKVL